MIIGDILYLIFADVWLLAQLKKKVIISLSQELFDFE
jgi:hypothetical protein